MASVDEAIRRVREICLSFTDTREGDHYGEAAYYVKGKLFATCGGKDGVCEIIFALEADHAAELLRTDQRFRTYPRDKRGLVVNASEVTDWDEMRALLAESYEIRRPPARKVPGGARTRRPKR